MAQEVVMSNGIVEATISAKAAEVVSFKKLSDGTEAVLDLNRNYWSNCNPILFPYYGPLVDGKYEIDGKEYYLGQHGFARRALFDFEEIGKDHAVLSLTYNEDTLKVYPFRFRITVDYTLEGSKLNLSYQIENLDERELPFNIGFHPAFNCPLTEDGRFEDYRIEFEKEEDLASEIKQLPRGKSFELKDVPIHLSHFYYNHQIKSCWVLLTDGTHGVKVGCEGYSILGFWRKNTEARFVCIEPWNPDNDLPKACTFRADTENNLLPAGQKFGCSYYFELI